MIATLLMATARAAPPQQLGLVNCSSSSPPWSMAAGGQLKYGASCATVVVPVVNNGLLILAECGNAAAGFQSWEVNKTAWPKAFNVSWGISLKVHPDSPSLGWGWTYDKGGGNNQPIQIFDVSTPQSRFHGECTGNNNCNFVLDGTQLKTFRGPSPKHPTGECVGVIAAKPPPPPSPPPPMPNASVAINFSSACGSHMVLQQAPTIAAVYGPVAKGMLPSAKITVSVSASGAAAYTVPAIITGVVWKALLKPTQAGGSYTIKVSDGTSSASISDVTFGDVWYCGGQSNMALPLLHTFSRNISRAKALSGKYNIRITGLKGNMNIDQAWSTVKDAAAGDPQGNNLLHFSSTCYYFGESMVEKLGAKAPPIGLIHTAWGGSMIEEWVTPEVMAECAGSTPSYKPNTLWFSNVVPYLSTSLKGFAWYQGENNCGGVMGNSVQKVGYGCAMPAMVAAWREAWSKVPGTTDPLAPFGVVTLASGGSEGGTDIGGMRMSQTGNFGTLPSPQMPNCFLAHAFDLGDPWGGSTSCLQDGCCSKQKYNASTCNKREVTCKAACAGITNTSFYMGPIHPRIKKPVGMRLAQAATNLLFGGKGAYAGPTLSGCSVAGNEITLKFNTTLLRGGSVSVKDYSKTSANSAMFALVDAAFWCTNTTLTAHVINQWGKAMCLDVGAPAWGACGNAMQCATAGTDAGTGADAGASEGRFKPAPGGDSWVAVDIKAASATTVTLDLSKLPASAKPLAIRYAYGNSPQGDSCCTPQGPADPCVPAACPLWSPESGLPGNPFVAKIVGGKCQCIPPMVCDE